MAGCKISPLAFTMAMEIIIRASKWVVGGERRQDGNLKWAGMKIKPTKSRSISISRGKLSDRKFVIGEEKIPIIRGKAVKSLGRWYQEDMNETAGSAVSERCC